MAKTPEQARKISKRKRERKKTATKQELMLRGLEMVDQMIADICRFGVTAITRDKLETVEELAEVVRSHKLRHLRHRLIALKGQMANTLDASGDFDIGYFSQVLLDASLSARAVRQYVTQGVDDAASEGAERLEDMIGKTWREAELQKASNFVLLELAYEELVTDTGFCIKSSYFQELRSGERYVEKLILPEAQGWRGKRSYREVVCASEVGIYPGYRPRRIKLMSFEVDARVQPFDQYDLRAFAECSVTALYDQFHDRTADIFAPKADHVLFAPAAFAFSSGSPGLCDAETNCITLADGPSSHLGSALAWFEHLLLAGPPDLVFGKVFQEENRLCLLPLSDIELNAGKVLKSQKPSSGE